MKSIAEIIAENLTPQCYKKHLEWTVAADPPSDCDQEKNPCGMALCDVVAQFLYPAGDVPNNPCPFDVENENMIVEESIQDDTGQITQVQVTCPLPKLPAELDCDTAKDRWASDTKTHGWYYCQNSDKENFDEACMDGIDNDGDGFADCEDDGCKDCKDACEGGTDVECENTCMNEIKLTKEALAVSRGSVVAVQCLQQFSFEDKNCQENSPEACDDGKDNDGNKIWDCEAELSGDNPHFPDPHCCPMVKGSDNKCVIDNDALSENCPNLSVDDPDGACVAAALSLGCEL
jgi:hypothetical protein